MPEPYVLQQRIEEQAGQIAAMQTALDKLTAKVDTVTVPAGPTISQEIRNGDLNHSWDTHENAVSAATDVRFEAWEIFTHTAPVAAQQLHEDSVFSGVLVAASYALPDAGRSDTPNVDPDWSRANGHARLGSTKTIDFPLPENHVFAGRSMSVSFIAAKRSANVTINGKIFAGLWDNTAGKRDWLPSSAFAISTATRKGIPVATVSRDYKIVGYTDYGRTIESTVSTIANGPDDASFISGRVYNLLAWSPIKGVIKWEIYRKTGAVYVLLPDPGNVTTFFDQGSIVKTVTGYPVTTDTKQIAYVETQTHTLDAIHVDGVNAEWSQYDIVIAIPPTWDMTGTTDKIWLRIGLTAACTGADGTRGILLDLISLSYQSGSFAHHPLDQGKQNPISAPNGSSQGGAGTGGGGFVPPSGGGGEERCVTPQMEVLTIRGWKRAGDLTNDDLLWAVDGETRKVAKIFVTRAISKDLMRVGVVDGELLCSPSEPFIQAACDRRGTRADALKEGSPLRIYDCDLAFYDVVPCSQVERIENANSEVVMISLEGSIKTFLARSPHSSRAFTIHNIKNNEGNVV